MENNENPQPEHESERSYTHEHSHVPTVKTLIAWHAPGRPFAKRSKEYFITSALIALLIEVICLLFGQYMLMLLIASFLFVVFVLATIPPHNFHYRISSEGVTVEDHFFLWQELYDFYFKEIHGTDVLLIRTIALIPGELTLTLGEVHKEHIKTILLPYLPFREYVQPTFVEKFGNFIAKNFPLERS